MSVVFTKTAKSSAVGSFQSAALIAVICCAFGAVALFVEGLPTFVKVLFAVLSFALTFWVASLIRQGKRYLQSGKDWRVEVTNRKLSWKSPVQETMASFDVLLSDITTVRHVATKTGSRGGRSHDYTIELQNGDVIEVSDQISGIHPEKVFDALHDKGVPFAKEFIYKKDEIREKRNQIRARRMKAKAKKQQPNESIEVLSTSY